MKSIRKAVFPVAGMGTRFLPATKANPKEMLPVVDKPLIQYAAEEAVMAGINTLVFINVYPLSSLYSVFRLPACAFSVRGNDRLKGFQETTRGITICTNVTHAI